MGIFFFFFVEFVLLTKFVYHGLYDRANFIFTQLRNKTTVSKCSLSLIINKTKRLSICVLFQAIYLVPHAS